MFRFVRQRRRRNLIGLSARVENELWIISMFRVPNGCNWLLFIWLFARKKWFYYNDNRRHADAAQHEMYNFCHSKIKLRNNSFMHEIREKWPNKRVNEWIYLSKLLPAFATPKIYVLIYEFSWFHKFHKTQTRRHFKEI